MPVSELKDLGRSGWSRLVLKGRWLDRKFRFLDFLALLLLSFVFLEMLRTDTPTDALPGLEVGVLANRTLRAPRGVEVSDPEALASERSKVEARIRPLYDYDPRALIALSRRWQEHSKLANRAGQSAEASLDRLSKQLSLELSSEERATLGSIVGTAPFERLMIWMVGPILELKITSGFEMPASGLELRDLQSGTTRVLGPSEALDFVDIERARSRMIKLAESPANSRAKERPPWSQWSPTQRRVAFAVAARALAPNVQKNLKESDERRRLAVESLKVPTFKMVKGEVIVREGERVSRRAAAVLAELGRVQVSERAWLRRWLEALGLALGLWMVLWSLRKTHPKLLSQSKRNWIASLGLMSALAMLKLAVVFQLQVLAPQFSLIPGSFFLFLIPVVAPIMVLRLLIGTSLMPLICGVYAMGGALLLDGNPAYGAFLFVCSMMASQFLSRSRTRGALYSAGLRTAVVTGLAAMLLVGIWSYQLPGNLKTLEGLGKWGEGFDWNLVLWCGLAGMLGGWLSSALALMLTPLFETLLDCTTDLKLLELSRMDHPLLRELVMKAPGTYHHSIVVGTLAEAGCEAIGAHALLARVGAYYHDVGKTERPEYFVENQSGGVNRHNTQKPHLSAKIIIAHVKVGAALAREHKLGQEIINFIEQHHGRGLVSYFFNKAKHEAGLPESSVRPEDISEEDFRYPGPKPQSKEVAVMSLADGCEAATRSLSDPTPARISAMVEKVFRKAFDEGLLEEAEITFRELDLVKESFIKILMGIHHNRVEYPDQEEGLPNPIRFAKPGAP